MSKPVLCRVTGKLVHEEQVVNGKCPHCGQDLSQSCENHKVNLDEP